MKSTILAALLKPIKNIAAPASLLIAGNLFLYQSAFIYKSSSSSFNYSYINHLTILIPLFLFTFILFLLPSLALYKKPNWQKFYIAFLTGLALSMWVAPLFKGSDGVLDGKTFLITTDVGYLIINSIILGTIWALGALLSWFQLKKMNLFLLFINLISIVSVISLIITLNVSNQQNTQEKQSIENYTQFSKEKNVLVILLDTFQSDFFKELLKKNPAWIEKFQGFTYFQEALSVSPTTYLAIASIHSGEVYKKGKLVSSFYEEVENNKSFMLAHKQQGYKTFILNPYLYWPKKICCSTEDYIQNGKLGVLRETSLLFDFSLFRSLPHFLKPVIYKEGKWFSRQLVEWGTPRAGASNYALEILASHLKTNSTQPTIKFIHTYASHPPAIFDQNGNRRDAPWYRESAIEQDQFAMSFVLKVLDALKAKKIYDQTAVFIIADHGARLAPQNGSPLNYAATPLVLFKPFNSHDPLQFSRKLVALSDIPQTICSATNDCGNFNYKGANMMSSNIPKRKLKFNYYEWNDTQFKGNEKALINEFEISGPPRDPASWKLVNDTLPPLKKIILYDDQDFFNYTGIGWEPPEKDWGTDEKHKNVYFRWTAGPFAELYLPLKPKKDAHIELSAKTVHKNQKFEVFANKQYIGKFDVNDNKLNTIKFVIPKSIIGNQPTHIVFKFNVWKKYQDIATENRYLAVAFSGDIKIESK